MPCSAASGFDAPTAITGTSTARRIVLRETEEGAGACGIGASVNAMPLVGLP